MFLELLLVLATFVASCWAGWQFSQYYFTSSNTQTGRLGRSGARRLFSLVFGACCNTIVLVMFELLGVLTFDVRLVALKAHIALLVVFMLCAIPCYHMFAVFRSRLRGRHALAVSALAQLAVAYVLLRLLPAWPGVPEPPRSSAMGLFSLRVAILRTGVLGVCVIAVLAGFGTVDFPYRVLRAFVVPVSAFEVAALQAQLQQVRAQVVDKEAQLAALQQRAAAAAASQAKEERGWFGGLASFVLPQSREAEQVKALQQSVEGLAVMEATLAADVAELAAEHAREKASATLLGRLLNVLGYALAAFCVLKMFICLKSVLFGDDFTSDPATRALGLALRVFSRGSVTVNVAALSQYITIAFVGFISFNSLRTFLKHVRRAASSVEAFVGGGGVTAAVGGAGSVTAAGSVTGSERAMLGLGALLCAYTVSSVMLLRAQLPVGHRLLVTRALGFDAAAVDSEFDAVHRWFNGMQLASLVGSLGLCYWQFKAKKANAMDSALPVFASSGMV